MRDRNHGIDLFRLRSTDHRRGDLRLDDELEPIRLRLLAGPAELSGTSSGNAVANSPAALETATSSSSERRAI